MEKTRQIFEKEWAIHREGGAWTSFTADAGKARANGDFDADPKVGEIRIFADMKRPFVALLAERRGATGWLIVPVSPFTVPASAREILVGERVFQLWNACTAAKGFVERSWRVDALDAADVAELKEAVKEANPGRITAGDGVVAEYEREYLVAGGSFEPVLAEKPRDARPRPLWIRIVRLSSLAAVLAIGFGVIYFGANNFGARRVKPATEIYYDDNLLLDEVCYSAPSEPSAPVEQAETAICRKPAAKAKFAMNVEKSIMPVPAAAAIPMADFDMAPSSFERYAEFNENEFQDAKSNPLSTFSLDVDTTSYALMRREIVEYKRLPVPHMVRLEEFVNYFRYDYAEPKDGDPIAVDCEMAPCPWNKNHRLARIALQAKRVEKDKIPPCNLTFLIDVSGSMDWNGGMAMVKKGLSLLVDELRDEDSVAIVTYANGTSVRLPSTPGSKKRKILGVIDSLKAGGATAGGAGIQLAYDEAKKNFDKARNNRVILITDGDFNIGISSPKELEDFIAAKRDSGVFLTVLGVGDGNYNDAMMKKLANAGNGNYAYIDSVLEAKKIMMDEFGGTLQTVAKDVKLQIEFNPAQVAGYRLLGYENRRLENKDFNDDRKDAGEIGSGHTMTAFYEIVPAGSGEAVADVDPLKYQKQENVSSDEAFTVKLRWKEPDGDKSLLREIPCTEAAITRKEATEDFRFASAVAEFALILERSKFKGDASFKSVLERARAAKGKDAEGYRAEFIRIVEAAELYSGK